MTYSIPRSPSKVNVLPRGTGSLARGLPPVEPGTLFVMGVNGGMSVAPDAGFTVIFGRQDPEVHVCVGPDDPHVSRQHGHISFQRSHWVLDNTGRVPIRFPGARLLLSGHRAELPVAYTPLFIVSPEREHLLEVRIAASRSTTVTGEHHDETTMLGKPWQLTELEHLAVVCLAQRYLRQEPQPQPLTWKDTALAMHDLRPAEQWTEKRLAHIVKKVRVRLSEQGVAALTESEVPPPVGNALNHNLIMELLRTTTIVPSDLRLIGG
ncbi:hypothetical protein [Fodinicola acaciae]|uniref:hypothetical protein n=1 Tax=Fodinicola acaciae TaxID=2681555 RepID=UPI001652553C|nr:hypothetical protein [Fodinicola acaciae]